MPDENELSDKAKQVLANMEVVDMREEGARREKQRELEFAKQLAAPEERKKERRETLNLGIALFALMASFYSVFITHRDAQETLHQTQRAYVAPDVTINSDSTFTLTFKATGQTPANHVMADMFERDVPDVGPKIQKSDLPNGPADMTGGLITNALLVPGFSQGFSIPVRITTYNPKSAKTHIVFGVIFYNDVFNKPHVTHYCISTDKPVSACDTGNDAD